MWSCRASSDPSTSPDRPKAMSTELGMRIVAFEVDDVQAAVDRVAADGNGLVGGIGQYEDIWRMVYVRGPEGIIVSTGRHCGPARGRPRPPRARRPRVSRQPSCAGFVAHRSASRSGRFGVAEPLRASQNLRVAVADQARAAVDDTKAGLQQAPLPVGGESLGDRDMGARLCVRREPVAGQAGASHDRPVRRDAATPRAQDGDEPIRVKRRFDAPRLRPRRSSTFQPTT